MEEIEPPGNEKCRPSGRLAALSVFLPQRRSGGRGEDG